MSAAKERGAVPPSAVANAPDLRPAGCEAAAPEGHGGVERQEAGNMQGPLDVEGLRLANLSSKMMKTNSKSHNWSFGAFAEIIDNAKDAGASKCAIGVSVVAFPIGSAGQTNYKRAITMADDGTGLSMKELHHMLSTGFCNKDKNMIGEYGNGLKSSSMRLGDDCLVFTSHAASETLSIGLYSDTFHREQNVDEIRLPCLTYRMAPKVEKMEAINVSHCEYQASLAILIAYTPYATEEALKARLLELFPARGEQNPALRLPGTHIELYNLSKDLDMDSNPQDIEQHYARHTRESYSQLKPLPLDTSLYEYLRLLYLDPGMIIELRGREVSQWHLGQASKRAQYMLSESLEAYHYKPKDKPDIRCPIWIGLRKHFDPKGRLVLHQIEFGTLIYHKRRLIRAMEMLGLHKSPSGIGTGVSMIVMEDFLDVSHDKQGYTENQDYRKFIVGMETKLQSYVREKVMDNVLKMDTRQGRVMLMEPIRKQYEEFEKEVEKLINIENSKLYCVQCDDCCKWRFMPSNYYHDTSREWTCYHPDHVAHNPEFASCDQPEEDPSLIPKPWRKDWVRSDGWRYIVKHTSEYQGGGFMVPQEDGTFDSFRIGPVQIKSALPGQAQRLNVPFNAVRDALEAAVAGLEKGINDGSSERWRVAAVELPKGQTARSSVGPWGALAALAKAWAGAGKRRTRKALDEAVDEALSSGKWAEEDETQMPRRQRAEQEWLEDEEEMHEEFLRFRVENGRKRGVQQKGKQQPCKAAKSRKGQSAREKATEAKMAKAAEQAARGATKRAEAEAERRREAERELARERALRLREQRVGGRPAGGPPSVHTPPQGVPPRRRGRFPLDPPRDPQGGKAPTSSSGPTRHCLCRLTAEEVKDDQMFVCSECHELFHPECVGLLLEDLRRRAELRDDHFTCEEHSPSVVERRMSLRRERSATTCSLSSHGRREDTADEALGGGGACEESAPLSKAAPSSAPEDRGQPSSWPKGAGCRYRNWLVWGDPGSEAEKLRSRNSRRGCIQGVEIRLLDKDHPVARLTPNRPQHGLFATRDWAQDELVGCYTGVVSPGRSSGSSCTSPFTLELDMGQYGLPSPTGILQIDANRVGNETRYINDYRSVSDRPNVRYRPGFDEATGELFVGVYTLKRIALGSELLINYGSKYFGLPGSLREPARPL